MALTRARRYAIAVGKDGLQYKGTVEGRRQAGMAALDPDQGNAGSASRQNTASMRTACPAAGRIRSAPAPSISTRTAEDTHLRIHGTIAPESIGTNSSNGCFRMINEHVMDLYRRVPVGTKVVVL